MAIFKYSNSIYKMSISNNISVLYKVVGVAVLCALFSVKSLANPTNILVGLEPFPPLVNEDGSGFVIDMLNGLQENSTLTFNYQIMTYARAKLELKSYRIDMVGLTPKDSETQSFYQYAQELSWHFDTTVDLYSTSPANFDIKNLPEGSIGTLIGNADFFAELAQVPREKFVEVSSLAQLIMMMARGRLKVILFERVAMMSTIKELQDDLSTKVPTEFNSPESPQKIYYQKFKVIAASLAVANDAVGAKLKKQLDALLSDDTAHYFKKIAPYAKLPDNGIIE
ncbi:transporter substrate-binding domain-containing protein [Colwellia sp. BRX8-4]|uniref:transporter substrate-binding domain-containing protein n=1 Tax=Colwellia sp. BRX8-4 TaxID=2759836 RepID=UPI0015F6701A|nr:transporter substrate-binding domain-containing protein [Colwellia sp. BRX8-4]MBA6362421.1 transporter substrate-binding domain-containing protein [Colwellia sp. BRX8-8]MBA6373236.1 transporter substrate-binding domain-containing protein [Colwellia sp. BRX8-4]